MCFFIDQLEIATYQYEGLEISNIGDITLTRKLSSSMTITKLHIQLHITE